MIVKDLVGAQLPNSEKYGLGGNLTDWTCQ